MFACAPKVNLDKNASTAKPISEKLEVDNTAKLVEGKSLYENICNKCHKLYDPKQYDKQQWIPILDKMKNKAKINEEDKLSIYQYIVSEI